jgi:hypothetical protein
VLEQAILDSWPSIAGTEAEKDHLMAAIESVLDSAGDDYQNVVLRAQAALAANKARSARLIDAFVDGTLDKESFEERKRALLEEQCILKESIRNAPQSRARRREYISGLCELASSAQQGYLLGNLADKREMALRLCANRSVAGKHVTVEPHFALRVLARRRSLTGGDPSYDATRTFAKKAWRLYSWAKRALTKMG